MNPFAVVRASVWGILIFCLAGFIFSRLELFVDAYHREQEALQNDHKILSKCQDPDFLATIKLRSPSLCEDAAVHVKRSITLTAFNTVANETFLCGYASCQDYLTAAVDTMLGHGWPFIAACGAVLLVVPSIVIRIVSSMLATSEQRRDIMFSRTPYGLENNAIMQNDFSQQENRFGLLRNRQIQYLRDTDSDL